MIWRIVDSVLTFFVTLFRLLQGFFSWIVEKTWALFLAIVTPLLGLFWSMLDTFKQWMMSVAGIETEGQDVAKSFADCINDVIRSLVSGDSFISQLCADVLEMLNIGQFVTMVLAVIFPVLLGVLTYRLVKSWVPTVSGG